MAASRSAFLTAFLLVLASLLAPLDVSTAGVRDDHLNLVGGELLGRSFALTLNYERDYGAPSPGLLQTIQDRHGRKDWWFVTTDSVRYLVRIHDVDERGLSGLKPKRASDPAPGRIAWPSIARIDERHSRFLAKRIQGVFLGGIAGASIPFLVDQTNGGDYAGVGLLAGAVIGGWLGGLYGDGIAREDPLYVSSALIAPMPATPAVPAPPADSARRVGAAATATPPAPHGDSPPSAGAPAPAMEPGDDSIAEACRSIHPADRLRIHADFGTFDGHVDHASPDGLSGLRPLSTRGTAETLPGVVTWDRIQRIDRAGSAAAQGARRGAIALGAVGAVVGLFAIALVSAANSASTEPSGSWILIGAAGGAAGGALIGAAIGSGGTSWRPIYVH